MIRINVTKQSSYPISTVRIKKKLRTFLEKNGIVSDGEVSVAFVAEKRMIELSKRFLKDNSVHNVLSFTQEESKTPFVYPSDGKMHLGEIVICYPKAVAEAKAENKLIEERVYELIEHGALHLLGKHHD